MPPQDITPEEIDRRFDYHAPSGRAKDIHSELRADAKVMAGVLARLLPAGREKSLAITALEEAFFWAHAAVARDPGLHEVGDGR